jgi:MFS family permease
MSSGLSRQQVRRALAFSNAEGATSTIMISLLGGTFLTAFAIYLGASPWQVGLMASLAPATQIGQVFTAYLVERGTSRRVLTTWSLGIYRVVWSAAGLLAVILPKGWNLPVFMLLYSLAWLIAAPGVTGWQSLMTDLVPMAIRGRYFGRRWAFNTALGVAAVILAGWSVDHFPGAGGFAVLYGLGMLATAANCYCLAELPEIPHEVQGNLSYGEHLRQPFRNPGFVTSMAWLAGWQLVQTAAPPFFTVLMAEHMGLSYSLISVLASVTALASAASFTLWGKLVDRRGAFWLAGPGAVLSGLVPALWLLAGQTGLWYLFLLHILLGVATAGLQIVTLQMSMQLAPPDQRAVHLAVINGANGLAGFVGPVLAGVLAEAGQFGLLFGVAGVIGLGLGAAWHWRLRRQVWAS